MYALEYSKHSEKMALFPFHIQKLESSLKASLDDCLYDTNGKNIWVIIFIGSQESCQEIMDELIKIKKNRIINMWGIKE